jgi:UDP-N-acetylmuramoyl-L-alanyl-D-glutamate--2,6-diaminopimelate ligase
MDIIEDISSHFNKKPIEIIDRKEAICKAIEIASKNDLVLIAGKGNEEFQEIGSQKIYFSDREVVENFFKERKSKN